MNSLKKVAVLVGSLRQASLSAGLAGALKRIAPADLQLEIVPIGMLALYNQDLEATAPAPWLTFRQSIQRSDAALFVTPEYNRSVPAVLKNAIDVGSRPKELNSWNGKPAAVISLSQGSMGGFGAAHHLRQSLVCLNVATMPAPEVYLSFANKLLDANGCFVLPDTEAFLMSVLVRFSAWIDRARSPQVPVRNG